MATIITRAGKGSPLTNTEVDDNFTNLNTDKAELSNPNFTGNVGIGTTSPQAPLHVIGDINLGKLGNIDAANVEIASLNFYNTDTSGSAPNNAAIIRAYSHSATGSGAYLTFGTSFGGESEGADATEKMRIDSSGKVGIGTTSPDYKADINVNSTSPDDTQVALRIKSTTTANMTNGFGVNQLFSIEDSLGANFNIAQLLVVRDGADDSGAFLFAPYSTGTAIERMRIASSGNVGINVTSPSAKLHIDNGATSDIITQVFGGSSIYSGVGVDSTGAILTAGSSGSANASMIFRTASNGNETESMRIDSSGNVLVGTTTQFGTDGISLNQSGWLYVRRTSVKAATFRLDGNDGNIITFDKAGSTVGSIGTETGRLTIGSGDTGLRLLGDTDEITPWNTSTNAGRDALIDLGNTNNRFKDIYRSGSTYSTSDRNKKQDIRDLTDAEARVATVAKGSLKAFRYIDSVEAEGDEANIHFGIIAQDLKAAFEAEGLNANDYQVFKTSTYTDDDGVEQTTYSICYENLLAFIIAAI